MLKLIPRIQCHCLLPSSVRQTALASATVLLLAGSSASAQSDGVVYVDDLKPQASARQSTQLPRPASTLPMQYRSPSPSQQSRFPQPMVQSLQEQAAPQKKSWISTSGFKKTLNGLFGGNKRDPSQAASGRPVSSRAGSSLANNPASGNRSTSSTNPGGLQLRTSGADNQPTGLFSLLRSKPKAEKVAAPTKPQANQRQSVAQSKGEPRKPWSLLSRRSMTPSQDNSASSQPHSASPETRSMETPSEPASIAMVTDLETPTPSLNSRPTEPSSLPKVTGPEKLATVVEGAPSRPTGAMPVEHVASDEQPSAVTTAGLETRDPWVTDQSQVGVAGRGKPREIVNHHAVANQRQPRPLNKRANAQPLPMAARQAATPVETTTHPANPVPKHDQQPSDKSVELLTEANRLAGTAATEKEFTTVLQICRHVLAIEDAPMAVEYCHDLASWALNRRGELKIDSGRSTEALLDFNDALRLDPDRYRAIHNRGVLAAQAGSYAAAFDDFNRTIALNPRYAKAYSNRGALYVQAGELQKASADYRQAIALDPDLAVAHKGRGRVCHLLGQLELALQHLDAATRLAPEDARIVNNRGDLLSDMGRYRSAAADYQAAIELAPAFADAHRSLAWLQATCPDRDCRNAEQAVQHARRAIELTNEPDDLEFDTLAAALAATGDYEQAVKLMDQALAKASDDERPNYEWRKQLYERSQPYISEPASRIQQASYAE